MQEFKTVQELLAVEERWAQGGHVFDSDGFAVPSINSPRASRFCLLGAVYKVYPTSSACLVALAKLEEVSGEAKLGLWNDAPERTHAEVLELVTKANV